MVDVAAKQACDSESDGFDFAQPEDMEFASVTGSGDCMDTNRSLSWNEVNPRAHSGIRLGILLASLAPSNGTPGSQVSSACQAQLLGMLNAEHGTNLTSANITDFYNNGTAANIIVDASGLSAAQFNSFQPGRYSSYGGQFLLGFGMAGHIANEPGVNAGAVFSNSNIDGNLSVHFAFHDDHGYANNPFGALIHFFTDVLGHNSRKPC